MVYLDRGGGYTGVYILSDSTQLKCMCFIACNLSLKKVY